MYNFINYINFYDNIHIFHLIRFTHTHTNMCVSVSTFTFHIFAIITGLIMTILMTYLLILSYKFYYILNWHVYYVTHLLSSSVDSFYILRYCPIRIYEMHFKCIYGTVTLPHKPWGNTHKTAQFLHLQNLCE